MPGPGDWFRGRTGTRKEMMQNNAGKRMSVCLSGAGRVFICFPYAAGRFGFVSRLPTADSDVPLSRWKEKKRDLRTCVHPLIVGPFDMLHLRRRKTPLCPAPRWGRGLGWSVWYGGIANIGTGLILSAQGQAR